MNKKIGIITYHNATNYGAAFQTKALADYLCTLVDDDVEIIDYRSQGVESRKHFARIVHGHHGIVQKMKMILALPQELKQEAGFRNYINSLKQSDTYTVDSIAVINDKYDYIIIGSDQLWNFNLNRGDTTYLLPFIKDRSKIVTYATSIGTSEISDEFVLMFSDCLVSYRRISVREQDAANLIRKYVGIDVSVVADPVFLPEPSYWTQMVKKEKTSGIFQYIFKGENVKQAEDIKASGLLGISKTTKIAGGISFKDYTDLNTSVGISFGPDEFLSHLYNAEYVLTDSFHCVAMSIVFHVPFTVFLKNDPGADARIIELLTQTGLLGRVYSPDCDIKQSIDWANVDLNVSKVRDDSHRFLNECFQG